MRIARLLVVLTAVFVVPTLAHAGPIVAGDYVVLTDGVGNTGGGEFNMFRERQRFVVHHVLPSAHPIHLLLAGKLIVGSVSELRRRRHRERRSLCRRPRGCTRKLETGH